MTFGGVFLLPNCNWFYGLVALFVVATLQPPNPSTAVANNPDQANHGNPSRMRLRFKQGPITSCICKEKSTFCWEEVNLRLHYSHFLCNIVLVCGKKLTYKRKKQMVDGDKSSTISLRLQKVG